MAISMDWSKITIVSVIAFLLGWWLVGLFGAVIITIVVLLVMGILKIDNEVKGKKRMS